MAQSSPRPPAESLAWIESVLGSGTRIIAWRRLTGGTTSHVHQLTVERGQRREQFVLRRLEPGQFFDMDWAVQAVTRESAALAALAESDVPAPRLIASTTDTALGGPAVLMTFVRGRVHLMPADRERWLRQMATMLTRIHALAIDAPPFESWLDPDHLTNLPGATRPDLWQRALALASEPGVPTRVGFVHRDYQHFNLLWTREKLTGVVDWVGAATGPPELDVGHCRLNLTVLFSAQLADQFLESYQAESGRVVDPRWDIRALLSYGPSWGTFLPYQVAGRAPLDVGGMTARMEAVLDQALRRV